MARIALITAIVLALIANHKGNPEGDAYIVGAIIILAVFVVMP